MKGDIGALSVPEFRRGWNIMRPSLFGNASLFGRGLSRPGSVLRPAFSCAAFLMEMKMKELRHNSGEHSAAHDFAK
ncbi:MAG TPA: hypothetical protein VFJ18_04415, partial [Pararhizobium sp.]|nr:hypothetical protein [Pararhizobium sp.]